MSKVEDVINNIPWSKYSHAYGDATDAPTELLNLLSEDEVLSCNAFYDWLYGAVFHQYTLYSATPFAIEVVLAILRYEDLRDKTINDLPTEDMLIEWLHSCLESSSEHENVVEALSKGKDVYERYCSIPKAKYLDKALQLKNMVVSDK